MGPQSHHFHTWDTQGREELSHCLGQSWFGGLTQSQYRLCPSLSFIQSVDPLSASHIFHPALLVSVFSWQPKADEPGHRLFGPLAVGNCSLFIFNISVLCQGGVTGRKGVAEGVSNQQSSPWVPRCWSMHCSSASGSTRKDFSNADFWAFNPDSDPPGMGWGLEFRSF